MPASTAVYRPLRRLSVCLVIVALIVLGAMAKRSQYHSSENHSPYLAKAVKMNETRTQKITAVSLIDALPPVPLMGWPDCFPISSTVATPAAPHDLHSMQLPSTPLRS